MGCWSRHQHEMAWLARLHISKVWIEAGLVKQGWFVGANSTKSRAPSRLSSAELQESPMHFYGEMN